MLLSLPVKSHPSTLSPALLERIITRLGFAGMPEPTVAGLSALYHAWCRNVPFDNILKLIHVRTGSSLPLPGTTATDFFGSWLGYNTGGTCWAASNAFHALLTTLGFEAERGLSTMMVAPDLPPNHGTVRVRIDGRHYLVDPSILHDEIIPLDGSGPYPVGTPASKAVHRRDDDGEFIRWRPFHITGGLDCKLGSFGTSHSAFARIYDSTRAWSPFNYQLAARINLGDTSAGLSFGDAVTFAPDGSVDRRPVTHAERQHILIEFFGINQQIAELLPEDQPTPPPPGSATARQQTIPD